QSNTNEVEGRVAEVRGSVVDVAFPLGSDLPRINDAVRVPMGEGKLDLILEVQLHLGHDRVRAISMDTTDGLQRGVPAYATGAPMSVPVGEAALGRIFNVLGRPIDGKGAVDAKSYYPIHREKPTFAELTTSSEVLETGIKVIDLIAPMTKGGKIGLFGGAG